MNKTKWRYGLVSVLMDKAFRNAPEGFKIFMSRVIVLCAILVYIQYAEASSYEEIDSLALMLNTSDEHRTVALIDHVIEEVIDYQFYYFARRLQTSWDQRLGDCTDKAMIKKRMLDKLGINNRLVYGFDKFGNKHDWYEYYSNESWFTNEKYSIKLGVGSW